MKKVLWFSRHQMTMEQLDALGNVEVTQISGSPTSVHVHFDGSVNGEETKQLPAFKELAQNFDILAVVFPVNLEQQVLGVAGEKPVIKAINKRTLVKAEDGGEDKVVFVFDGWKQIVKIEVVLSDFSPVE